MPYTLSTTNYIKALQNGISWGGSTGQASTTITYSYTLEDWRNDEIIINRVSNILFDTPDGFAAGGSVANAIEKAVQTYSNVANITFQHVEDDSSNLAFREMDIADFGTLASTRTVLVGTSTVNDWVGIVFDSNHVATPNSFEGNQDYYIILHEIGHALGLSHVNDTSTIDGVPVNPYAIGTATLDDSIMTVSGFDGGTYASQYNLVGPQIYDIAALQYIYGANTSYNNGDTIYRLTPEIDNSNVAFDRLTIIEPGQADQTHGNVANDNVFFSEVA